MGGRSSILLCRTLGNGGCMVSYGGMSKQPVQVPTGNLIFNDISLRGFWMSRWYEKSENYDVSFINYDSTILGTCKNV